MSTSKTGRTIDISTMSDNVLDVVLASRTGEAVDCEHLTVKEIHQLGEALGWSSRDILRWTSSVPAATGTRGARDYEGAILARQDRIIDF